MNVLTAPSASPTPAPRLKQPRLGFLGLGWIGMNRLEAIARSGCADIAAVADVSSVQTAAAKNLAPAAVAVSSLDDLLEVGVDGVVIATPSAQHAAQAARVLERGCAVFCQKPLARNAAEVRTIIESARMSNRLLGVDFSYRYLKGIQEMYALCQGGELGEIYAVDLQFHNAYGPGKEWFFDRSLSGGGCLIDLGVHLADLALWMLGFPEVTGATARMFRQGRSVQPHEVEDYAEARLDLQTGTTVRIACSWNLPAGVDAVIQGSFHGTRGGVGIHNLNGSFYDFRSEKFQGTRRTTICEDHEGWATRAILAWAGQLQRGSGFQSEAADFVKSAEAIDRLYAAAGA